jgi:hypothetical protein
MVPKHRVEELWFRFCTAKDIFFAKKKEHIGDIVVEQEENLIKKLELIVRAEALKESKQWKETSDAYTQLMDEWKKIGKVPQERSDEVWNIFLAAKNYFYDQKNNHFSKIKVQLEDNHARKMAIVHRAEEIQDSMDFDNATAEYLEMFEEWKKIGRVPKEYGDEAWERFQKAKKTFFDRKDENREKRKQDLSKDIKDRYERNRSYYNKISRELQREEELLFDMNDRIDNLPVTLRSYEKREEYLEVMEEIKAKVTELKEKAKEVKEKMYLDEREMSQIMRGPRKKEHTHDNKKKEQSTKEHKNEKTAATSNESEQVEPHDASAIKISGDEISIEENSAVAEPIHEVEELVSMSSEENIVSVEPIEEAIITPEVEPVSIIESVEETNGAPDLEETAAIPEIQSDATENAADADSDTKPQE